MMCLAIVKTKFNDSGSITSSTRLRDMVAHKIMPMSNAVHMLKAAATPNTASTTPSYTDSIDNFTFQSKNIDVISTSNTNTNGNKFNNNPPITSSKKNGNINNTITATATATNSNKNNASNGPSRLLARIKSNSITSSNNDINNDMTIETHIPLMTKKTNTDTTPNVKGTSLSRLRDITNDKIITPNRVITAMTNDSTPTYKVVLFYYSQLHQY